MKEGEMGMSGELIGLKRLAAGRFVWVVDGLCVALLAGVTLWVAWRYGALPERIPVHYGADGVVDGYGGKRMVWVLVAMAWFPACVISVVERFPRLWSFPVRVSEKNRRRLLIVTRHWLGTTKLALLGLFLYLTVMVVRGENLSPWFMPVWLVAMFVNSLFWSLRLLLNR